MKVDDTVREVFERSGMTQLELSFQSKTSLGTVNRFANGSEIRTHKLEAIAAVFGYEIAARKPRGRK